METQLEQVMHKVHLYPTAEVRKTLSSYGPVETKEFADLDDAVEYAHAKIVQTNDPFMVSVRPSPNGVTLQAYVDALNTSARYLEENPQDGGWISRLMDAVEWTEAYGIDTAEKLDEHLFWVDFSESYKEETGMRPTGYNREQAEEWMARS